MYIRGMETFEVGDRVIFRESETGPEEPATVTEVIPPNEYFTRGVLYIVEFDSGYSSEVFWTELTKTV